MARLKSEKAARQPRVTPPQLTARISHLDGMRDEQLGNCRTLAARARGRVNA